MKNHSLNLIPVSNMTAKNEQKKTLKEKNTKQKDRGKNMRLCFTKDLVVKKRLFGFSYNK